MILWELFSTFFGIGVVSFGGGYGMISLVREAVARNGWLAESEFLDFIAVSESTPGSLAVNMATFIGSSQAGVLGSLLATLGVVLPSFLAILLIAAVIRNLLKYGPVQAFLAGVRPCVVGMILSTAATMGLTTLLATGGLYLALYFLMPFFVTLFAPTRRYLLPISALLLLEIIISNISTNQVYLLAMAFLWVAVLNDLREPEAFIEYDYASLRL